MASVSDAPSSGRCANCADLEAELRDARAERDRSLLELARAREELNALRLARAGEELRIGEVDGAPLRYLVADRLNDGIKRVLGPAHGAVRGALSRLGRWGAPR